MTPLLILLLLYSAGLIALGAWIGRSVRKSEDFFVGGRSLGAGLIFGTFAAANIGAASTVNATGLAYHHGLAAWWWNGAAGIGTLILAFWVGPRIWRLASAQGYLTVGDFLDDHFGRSVRLVATGVIWFGSLSIFAAQIIGAAAVLSVAGNVPFHTGALLSVAAMTAYFAVGGLLSSAWVNRIQLMVILAGFALAVPYAVGSAGGVKAVATAAPGTSFWFGVSAAAGWPLLLLVAPNFFLSPGLLQRAFAAKDEAALRKGVGWCGVLLVLFAFVPVALGMSARLLLPDLGDAPLQQILPALLATAVPPAVGALALAAVFSAEISSADAVLYMLSTSGARDIYRGVLKPNATDAELLLAARVIAVIGGIGGFILVFYYESIYQALGAFYSVVGVTLLAPVLGGLFLPRGGRVAAMSSILVGLVVLYGLPYLVTPGGWLTPSLACLSASVATYLTVALVRR